MSGIDFNEYFGYPEEADKDKSKYTDENIVYTRPKDKKFPFLRKTSMFNVLQRTDEALLNSILSFAVYDRNKWMMENMQSELSDMAPIVHESMKDKTKMYNLKVWHFIKNTFEKIPDHELKIPSENVVKNAYGYQTHFNFKDGQYSAADGLAHACVLKSTNSNGGHILHLSFRGTEFSRLFEYIKGPYLDMSAYYENFKPLVNYLREYVNNPDNNITELHVNGHSLGGAMVQEFLRNNPPENFNVPVKGFTFGSPGSDKNWYHKFATIAYHTLGRGISVPSLNTKSINDDRITQFYHTNDPVPLVGLLGYTKGGNNFSLPDVTYEESKQANLEKPGFLEKIPAFGKLVTFFKENLINKFNTKFHDSARYIMNLRNHIEDYYKEYPNLGDEFASVSTKNWQNWLKQEQKFSALSIKYRSAFEYLVTKDEPNLTKSEINDKILKIRESMKYDSEADVILSRIRKSADNYSKFVKNTTTLVKNSNESHENTAISDETLSSSLATERIQRLKNTYNEKMEARSAVFKKK